MYRRALVHALYLGLSLLFASRFFPLAHPTSHAMTNGDPALECWALQWVSHALVRDPLHLYAGNTFYPYPHAVVLGDPVVSLAVLPATRCGISSRARIQHASYDFRTTSSPC